MEDNMKEAVEVLDKKMADFVKTVNEKTAKEIKGLQEAAEKEKRDLEARWKKDHDELIEKGATIEDLQDEVKSLKAKGGRFSGGAAKFEGLRQTISNGIATAIGEAKADIIQSASGTLMKPVDIKTVGSVVSANLTVDNFISYLDWRPGMEATGQFHFRNLVRTIISETDFIQFPRANTPIGEGSFGRQTEGVAKAQVDRDYTMVALTLTPMAAFSVASRQALRNILFLQSWLPESMMNQLEESEDTDFGNSLVAAATGSSSTTGFSGTPNVADKLVYYIKNNIAAKYNPTGVACDPSIWANLILLRPGTAGESYSGPVPVTVDTNGITRILGRAVYPVNWLTGGRVLVGDFSRAAIVQSEGLRLRQSDSHASLFTSNEIAFLLERTEGLAIFRPDAFITAVL